MSVLFLALAIVALILGAIDIFRSRGGDLTSWGVVALALIHVLGYVLK